MRKRDKMKNKFNKLKKIGITLTQLFDDYKQVRNAVNIKLSYLRKKWFENRINESKQNPKKLWNVLSQVVYTKNFKKVNEKQSELNVDDINHYFVNRVSNPTIITENSNTEVESTTEAQNFSLSETTVSEVHKIVSKLEIKKSVGSDGISGRLLKLLMLSIIPIITTLINLSFVSAKVPNIWKKTRVRALYKSGNRSLLSNYRPISVLSVISKIMERLVFNKLFEYLTENNKLSDFQFGFRARHSCSDALLSILNKIYAKYHNKQKVCMVTLDLKKAFD